MSKDVIMPALGMAQETGTLLRWLKAPGDSVAKGELLMEVETDKANVEIEAPASGILSDVSAQPGDVIPVGQVIARIVTGSRGEAFSDAIATRETSAHENASPVQPRVSPVAARIAQEHGIDVSQIKNSRGVIQKEDVLEYINRAQSPIASHQSPIPNFQSPVILASPKARRLANERGIDLKSLRGSGPDGAVLAADVLTVSPSAVRRPPSDAVEPEIVAVSNLWRVMVERLSNAWTTIPHFYLARDVNATRLISWRDVTKSKIEKITYTDLLVKLISVALQRHPRVNASWSNNQIVLHQQINVGLAVAVEQGLTVPVIHNANELSLKQISERRAELIERAHAGKLSLNDLRDGTFTISNLGMYGVDAFNAIVNPPQAAILAVSRIAERVVPVNHQPSVQPMMTLTLSCDHRVIDGARGAQFLDTLAQLIEEPLSLLE
jgi:pyruvate dehydrogenase E2 component (dihydrolipoamide acetyltransferase)